MSEKVLLKSKKKPAKNAGKQQVEGSNPGELRFTKFGFIQKE